MLLLPLFEGVFGFEETLQPRSIPETVNPSPFTVVPVPDLAFAEDNDVGGIVSDVVQRRPAASPRNRNSSLSWS